MDVKRFDKTNFAECKTFRNIGDKYSAGQVTIIGGSKLFHGAPLLALKAASRMVSMTYFSSPLEDKRVVENIKAGLSSFVWVDRDDIENYIDKSDSNKRSDKAIATSINLLIETGYLVGTPGALGAMIGCRRKIFGKIGGFNPQVSFAEDADFIRTGYKKGYSFSVIHEPRYVYSLRRFRKVGTLKLLQKYAVLNIKYMTNQKIDQQKEYPMGGKYTESIKSTSDYFKNLRSVFVKKVPRKKIAEQIKALLSLEESEN